MSKSMSGARSLLDSRMSQQEAGDNVASSGDNGLGSGKYGQFSALKQQKQKSRNPEKVSHWLIGGGGSSSGALVLTEIFAC